jgi:N-acetylmuramoyl-L-alanine amidase
MGRRILSLVVLVPALAGCGTYVGTRQVARRMGPAARVEEAGTRAVIVADGHRVLLESGASMVFIDGSPVMLKRPVRMVDGRLEVPAEIYDHLPRTTAGAADGPITFPPDTTARPGSRDFVPPSPIRTVIVDPGHGGDNLGATYGGVREKDVTLDVARRMAEGLRRGGMTVVMTRSGDVALKLEERSAAANARAVDLFVSVHANAAPNLDATGVEVFHLGSTFRHDGRTYDDVARALELNRNRRHDRDLSGTGRTPPPVTAADLARRRGASARLAGHIERALVRRLGVASRGVKTAGFAVLKWTAAPAVLVEIGFLSNRVERTQLADVAYRRKVADAVVEGILAFRDESAAPF